MKSNNWWIRDLFRYGLATLYSIAIIPYMIWSFFATILVWNTSDDSVSGVIAEYVWSKEDLADNVIFTDEESTDFDGNESEELTLNIWDIAIDDWNQDYDNSDNDQDDMDQPDNDITNQFLQNGDNSGTQEYFTEEFENDEESEWWNKFDIEKTIADLHLQKEKRVAVVAKALWIDWKNEKLEYAKLAWIQWEYNWSLEQNQKIRNYLIDNAQGIYKDKHWWNEWDTLPLVAKEEPHKKMNEEEIKWQVTYNDVTLKVSAPVGSFPEWTVLKIKTLEDDDSITTFDITFKEVILMTQVDNVEYDAPMASFDISFYAPDDTEFIEELQPAEWKSVSVTFDYANNTEFKNPADEWFLAIYHMEDTNESSIANLVSVKDWDGKLGNIKSDSMSIYANTLSVYILTVVSDLDEESEDAETIKFDAGYGGFIVENEDIVLSYTWTEIDAVYTWKIVSKNNEISLPDVKTASWYNFWWWYNWNVFLWNAWTIYKLRIFNNFESEEPEWEIEIYACIYWEDFTGDMCTLTENWDSNLNIIDSSVNSGMNMNIQAYTPSVEEIEKYGEDVFVAYNWAINNWITTIDNVSKVKFNKKITRAELAKMMVVFMSWTLQREPLLTWEVNYKDIDAKKLWDLTWYIQLAYQYQIMGIRSDWSPMENFNPDKTVTRAEFATVLSRVLFGNTYNQGWVKYYEKHIEALEKANILNNTNPNLVEARWRIMTMLYNTQNIIVSNDNQGGL